MFLSVPWPMLSFRQAGSAVSLGGRGQNGRSGRFGEAGAAHELVVDVGDGQTRQGAAGERFIQRFNRLTKRRMLRNISSE